MIICQYFISCNKCASVMLDVNNRENDVEGGGREAGFLASCFYKLKSALSKKKLSLLT